MLTGIAHRFQMSTAAQAYRVVRCVLAGSLVLGVTAFCPEPAQAGWSHWITARRINKIDKVCSRIEEDDSDALEAIGFHLIFTLWRLSKTGMKAAPAIRDALKDPNRDWKTKYFLCEVLEDIRDPESIPILENILYDAEERPELRRNSAGPIAAVKSPLADEILLKSLKDPEIPGYVREGISQAIATHGVHNISFLEEMARGSDQVEALRALGHSSNPEATEVLLRLIEDQAVRFDNYHLIEALGNRKDPEVIPALLDALTRSKDSRSWAAQALGNVGRAEAVEPLIKVLEDEDKIVVWRSGEALGKIGDKRAVDPLKRVLDNAKLDPRFADDFDKKTGKPSRGLMSVPGIQNAYQKLSRRKYIWEQAANR